jgi:hypothetical protein
VGLCDSMRKVNCTRGELCQWEERRIKTAMMMMMMLSPIHNEPDEPPRVHFHYCIVVPLPLSSLTNNPIQ